MNSYDGLKVYYGDLHNHCAVSYAHGPLSAALENARMQLDFVSITGHADWPDMPERDERIGYIIDFHELGFKKFRKSWNHYLETIESFNENGRFITYPGYEVHSSKEGDYTIVYRNQTGELLLGNSIQDVKHKLKDSGAPVLAFPHHLSYPLGSRGVNWNVFSEEMTPALEILSMHGIAENCETHRPFLHSMGPTDFEGTVRHGLEKGLRFGFLGNTDHHSAYPGSYGHGRTGVWASSLSREDIWSAIFDRRTFAVTGDRMDLRFEIDGAPMGSVISPSGKQISFDVSTSSPIHSIEMVKNGRITKRFWPEGSFENPAREFESFVFLEVGWGEKRKTFKWDVELEISGGEILGVEPRFRGMEVVSPVEKEKGTDIPFRNGSYDLSGNKVRFEVVSQGNPTNTTSATQGFGLKVRLNPSSVIKAQFNAQKFEIPTDRLLKGSFARNLGKIDSPAFRFHRLPLSWETQLKRLFMDRSMSSGDHYYLRVGQDNNQYGWTSPVFIN